MIRDNSPLYLLFCNFLVILYHCIINFITIQKLSKPAQGLNGKQSVDN